MPEVVHQGVEALIGVVIFALGLRLLVRHGRGEMHEHPHETPQGLREAYVVGVVHGAGGSAAIGLLIIAAIPDHGVALAGLVVFAISAALAMSAVAAGLGRSLRAVPAGPTGGFVCAFGLGTWLLRRSVRPTPFEQVRGAVSGPSRSSPMRGVRTR